jgi:MFS superfamily sulfate permease-like transporter
MCLMSLGTATRGTQSAAAVMIRWVAAPSTPGRFIVAAEPVTSVDVTAADTVAELDEALRAVGIELGLAELKDPVKDKLKRFGLFAQIGEAFFFPL